MRRATSWWDGERLRVFKFQSTLSMRRATLHVQHQYQRPDRISIHALHEESDSGMRELTAHLDISIHALHEESDSAPIEGISRIMISIHALHEESDTCATWLMIIGEFQSTLSMRRATAAHRAAAARKAISIHALHEESDRRVEGRGPAAYISIHALHEESDVDVGLGGPARVISIHALARLWLPGPGGISIHALHEESDPVPR